MASVGDTAQVVSAGANAVAAVFAAASAVLSRSAVERGNLAFVWPEFGVIEGDDENSMATVWVRLHSDGPGIALDVRWSLFAVPEPGRRPWKRAEEEMAAGATRAVRALRPGTSFPSHGENPRTTAIDPITRDEPWWIEVRWTDSAGRRWRFTESTAGLELAGQPSRVRRPKW